MFVWKKYVGKKVEHDYGGYLNIAKNLQAEAFR